MAQLQEKILLVTGASQGIGEQVAKAYAAAGATVVLVARHQKKLEKVYDEIVAGGGPEPFAICFDLLSAEEGEFERLAATIAEATGGRVLPMTSPAELPELVRKASGEQPVPPGCN